MNRTLEEMERMDNAIQDIRIERAAQDQQWGEQNHDMLTWSAIMTEEVGEFAKAALHDQIGRPSNMREEAVQMAAVALAIIECLDRNTWMR